MRWNDGHFRPSEARCHDPCNRLGQNAARYVLQLSMKIRLQRSHQTYITLNEHCRQVLHAIEPCGGVASIGINMTVTTNNIFQAELHGIVKAPGNKQCAEEREQPGSPRCPVLQHGLVELAFEEEFIARSQ